MNALIKIPIFPLNILPLPDERVPLHIFEPRYQQLLVDIEASDSLFGIDFRHAANTNRIGSLVRLENIIKRYPTGESDIMVKGIGAFNLHEFYTNMPSKLYPGGKVVMLDKIDKFEISEEFAESFKNYANDIGILLKDLTYSIHDVAYQLDLDSNDRIKYMQLQTSQKAESFLLNRLRYRQFIIEQEERSKDTFFLN